MLAYGFGVEKRGKFGAILSMWDRRNLGDFNYGNSKSQSLKNYLRYQKRLARRAGKIDLKTTNFSEEE